MIGSIIKYDTKFLRKMLFAMSIVLSIAGGILFVFFLTEFVFKGSPSNIKLQLVESIIALLVGFYHLLFAGLCYGMYTALIEDIRYPPRLKKTLYLIGISSIIFGVIGIGVLLLGNTALVTIPEPFASYSSVHMVTGIYGICMGLLCLSISLLNEKKFDLVAIAMIGATIYLMLGIFLGGAFFEKSPKLIYAFLAVFYNFLFAFLCVGISAAVNPEKLELEWLNGNLVFFGYGSIILGCVEFFFILISPSLPDPISHFKVISAILSVIYGFGLGGLCLGLSTILVQQIQESMETPKDTNRCPQTGIGAL